MQSGRQYRKPIYSVFAVLGMVVMLAPALPLSPLLLLTVQLLPTAVLADAANAAGAPARRAQTSCPDTNIDADTTPPTLYALPRCNQWGAGDNGVPGANPDANPPPA